MSTEFMPSKRIAFERIRNFNHKGVTAHLEDRAVLLRDGTNCLWAYPACANRRVTFVRQGDSEVMPIIDALEDYFHMRLITEDEDDFFDIIKTERALVRRRKGAASKRRTHP